MVAVGVVVDPQGLLTESDTSRHHPGDREFEFGAGYQLGGSVVGGWWVVSGERGRIAMCVESGRVGSGRVHEGLEAEWGERGASWGKAGAGGPSCKDVSERRGSGPKLVCVWGVGGSQGPKQAPKPSGI